MLETRALPPRYADARLLARGGMGEVYVATDRELGRPVAVKLLDERFSGDLSIRRRFTREALAAARLSGTAHVVMIFDVGEWKGRPYIVMQHLAGGTLSQRAAGGPLAPAQAVAWLQQAAAALDAAHHEGIVHRDVKPANLIFDERGDLFVADFGIARLADASSGQTTVAGSILGTAGYLSPEQARGEPATAASDVYALGIVAYELLTGGRPFERGSETAEALAHLHDPVPPPSSRAVGLPPAVDGVFERVLAKRPGQRYASAGAFVAALAAAVCPERPTAAPTRILPPAGPGQRRRRSRLPLVAVLLAVLAAGAAAAAIVTRGDGQAAAPATSRHVVTHTTTHEVTVTTPGQTVTQTAPAQTTPTQATTTTAASAPPPASGGGGHALNDRGYALYRQGRYAEALHSFERAVKALRGSGPADPYEGYANYNLGTTLIHLQRCKQAIGPLKRAQRLEGDRPEVGAALQQAHSCR